MTEPVTRKRKRGMEVEPRQRAKNGPSRSEKSKRLVDRYVHFVYVRTYVHGGRETGWATEPGVLTRRASASSWPAAKDGPEPRSVARQRGAWPTSRRGTVSCHATLTCGGTRVGSRDAWERAEEAKPNNVASGLTGIDPRHGGGERSHAAQAQDKL